jgi:hypothetical protein
MVGGRGPVNGAITVPMIYVGHATAADLAGRGVSGKIAVMHGNGVYGATRSDDRQHSSRREPRASSKFSIRSATCSPLTGTDMDAALRFALPWAGPTAFS